MSAPAREPGAAFAFIPVKRRSGEGATAPPLQFAFHRG